jgi:excinuclease ABC subunit C
VLDDIPGIGDKQKRLLLTAFDSVEDLKRATPEAIGRIPGIGPQTAAKILSFLGREGKPSSL